MQKLKSLFQAALERPPTERRRFLREATETDEALRDEVASLLEAHEITSAWIDWPAVQCLSDGNEHADLPRHFGPYRVLRELGHGGMGSVYLAERAIGKARQQVAVKVVRSGLLSSADIIRRFEQEREILASLDHQNIARLLDIGTTADAIPFLVMEYIDGEAIDRNCDRRCLTISERLELFTVVCQAVHYAHSKGVVHRDLKPSNVLITANGSVKLLDFGIATMLHGTGEQTQTVFTHAGCRPMTVEYASPEQIRGEVATVTSDVYSLGVLLNVLITGRSPYNVRIPHDIFRAICEDPPVLPSAAVCHSPLTHSGGACDAQAPEELANLRRESPKRLQRRLRGDLDSIVTKALRKEPGWRYTSAAELAEDIRLHLEGAPVRARKSTIQYRLQKAIGRVLNPSSSGLNVSSALLAGWGMFGVLILVEKQFIAMGWKHSPDVPYAFASMIVLILWSIREGRRMASQPVLPSDRTASIVLAVTLSTLLLLMMLSSTSTVVPETAMSVFWNSALAIAFLILGLQASPMLTFAGVCLLISVVVGCLSPVWLYAWLAAGLLAGCVIPGLILAFRSPDIRDLGSQTVGLTADGPLHR